MTFDALELTTIPGDPYFEGMAATSEEVPWLLPIAIGGHSYQMDVRQYERNTLEVLRPPYDMSTEPGEQSLTTVGVWRRHFSDWRDGAGQMHVDDRESRPAQYWVSKGIDSWDRTLKLHYDTDEKRTSTNTTLLLMSVGGYMYVVDGSAAHWTTDPSVGTPSFTAADIQSHEGGNQPITSITTDGLRVFAACGSNGIDKQNIGGTTGANHSAFAANLVEYANGRLLAAAGADLSEISNAGTATTIKTHDVSTFEWTCIAGAPNGIYVGGNLGDRSEIYYVGVTTSTGALAVPVAAGPGLPDGEKIHAMTFYLGFIVMGTSKGFRIAKIDTGFGTGFSLSIGPLIDLGVAVKCFEVQGDFVWFGWKNYDSTSSGLGRMHLGNLTDDLVPAYASDLMVTAQADITSVVTFNDKRYFGVSGDGFYGQDTTLVAQGTYESGWVRFNTFEQKVAVSIDLRHEPLNGTIAVVVESEDGTEYDCGSSLTAGTLSPPSPLSAGENPGESFNVKLTLTRASTPTLGPVVKRVSFRCMAVPRRTEEIIVPIINKSQVESYAGEGKVITRFPLEEWQHLKMLEGTRRIVSYQEGTQTYRVVVDRLMTRPDKWASNRDWFEGLLFVRLLTTEAIEQ